MKGVVCAGNWLLDVVHLIPRWPAKSELVEIEAEVVGIGGGGANVMLALEAFATGIPLFAMGLIGDDRYGQITRAALAHSKADLRWLVTTDRALSSHTHVMTVAGESRTFFYHPGTNDLLSAADLPVEAAANSGAGLFYLGYLNLLGRLDRLQDGQTEAAQVLARAKAAGMVTCVDLVSKAGPNFRAVVAASLPVTDYLFLNEIEATLATGIVISGPGDTDGMERAARHLLAMGAGCVVLHSPLVALMLGPHSRHLRHTGAVAEIVNPVGAGDAFAAGVIYGIAAGWPAERSLLLGHRAAAASLKGATATGTIPSLKVLVPDQV